MRMAYTTNEKLPGIRAQAARLIHDGWSTRRVARYLGYTQGTIVKWKQRTGSSFPRIIETRSSRPKSSPKALNQEIIGKIIKTRIETKRIYSRYGFAMLSETAYVHASIRFMRKARRYFDFRIRVIQTDNGPEFGKFFSYFVSRNRMMHRHIHVRSPNENGHLEKFNRTIQEEMPRHKLCILIPEDVSQFINHYNHKRMHMGINFKTPNQML